MISFRRYLGSLLIAITPSSFFRFKRVLLSFMSIDYGNNVKVNIGVKFYGTGEIAIGDNTWIGPNCTFYTTSSSKIIIGSNCDIAPEVSFVCGSHEIGDKFRRAGSGVSRDIFIGNGCWIGVKSVVLGADIEDAVVVGASSLVNKDLKANTVCVGVPAKKVKSLEE